MREFFKQELETLYERTGFKQFINIMQEPDFEDQLKKLLDHMVAECNRPPFNILTDIVKQRIISKSIMDDEFTGLNAKFVRKALNAWWGVHGQRVLEARDEKNREVYEPVVLSDEKKKEIDKLANEYRLALLRGDGFQKVPKLSGEEIAREGKENPKERPVAICYPKTPAEQVLKIELHTQYIRENYDAISGKPKSTWIPENEWLDNLNKNL